MDLFKSIFGDKPWYKSLTAWGLIVFSAATALEASLASQCQFQEISGFACEKLLPGLRWLGGIMATLGIRKAAN